MTNTDHTEQATAHTPEPWRHYPSRLVDSSLWKAQVQPPECERCSSCAGYGITKEQAEANARRICAAVNACKCLSTEALEHGVVAELVETIRDSLAEIEHWNPDRFDKFAAVLEKATAKEAA